MQNTGYLQIENMIQKIFVARGQRNSPNEAWEICKRCNKVASCFFLIRSSVERYKLNETERFSRVEDFSFSMSPRDLYYQFYKNAPAAREHLKLFGTLLRPKSRRCPLSVRQIPYNSKSLSLVVRPPREPSVFSTVPT